MLRGCFNSLSLLVIGHDLLQMFVEQSTVVQWQLTYGVTEVLLLAVLTQLASSLMVLFDLCHRRFSELNTLVVLPQSGHRRHFRSFGLTDCHSKVEISCHFPESIAYGSHTPASCSKLEFRRVAPTSARLVTPASRLLGLWSRIFSISSVRFMKKSSTGTIGCFGVQCCLLRSVYKGSGKC